ncbi:universal stress protein [Halocatena pleomorpha]|uniref:Universal stress protein n=1 Tax=Halocatena pleomorpha TaxID=1785090 RepID=A0A3P3R810_9EURY|nr:universal stress protein [Halocatena pleomorpha]RRJ29566.1 universal stress protein [Halocatena pleomorpha]
MSDSSLEEENILVPIDGSNASKHAFDYALNFPAVSITILTVINPFDIDPVASGLQSPSGRAGIPGYSQEWYEEVEEKIKSLHERKRERAADSDITIRSEIRYGSSAQQIVKYTQEQEIDHVILGRHSKDPLSRMLLGNVSESVVRRVPAVVTVVS